MTTADNLLALGPVALYLLDETSGTTLVDSSGNGRDGTYMGTPTFGHPGLTADSPASVAFNGTDAYAEVAYDAGWMALSEFSVVGSFMIPSGAWSGYSTVLSVENMLEVWAEESTTGFKVGGIVWTDAPDMEVVGTEADAISYDTPIRVLFTYDGAMARLYVDATLIAEKAIVGTPLYGEPFRIASWGGTDFSLATVDEVALFDRVLTPGEIDAGPPVGTDTTSDVSLGYGYDGYGTVGDDLSAAAVPAGVYLPKIVRVHQSLPAPTLVDGRPT